MLLQPTILTTAWGSVVRQIAAGLDVELDAIEEHYERLPAPETFEIASGTIDKGTAAALRFEVRGMRNGRAVAVLEHVTRLRDDLGPDWPQPAGHGCYRVVISGEPNYTLDMQLLGSDGDHNTAGLKATAMRLVNAVPAVVDARPGLLSALDLPLITGRGLVSYGTTRGQTRAMAQPSVPAGVRPLILASSMWALGIGLVLPLTLIYLHSVRGIPLRTTGVLLAIPGVIALVAIPVAGTLVDRVGARLVLATSLSLIAVGEAILVFASTSRTAAVALLVLGVAEGPAFPAFNTLLAERAPGRVQQRAFGINFTLFNAAIGLGAH